MWSNYMQPPTIPSTCLLMPHPSGYSNYYKGQAMPISPSLKPSRSSSIGPSRQKSTDTANSKTCTMKPYSSTMQPALNSTLLNSDSPPAYTTLRCPAWQNTSRTSRAAHSHATTFHRWDNCPKARSPAFALLMAQESHSRREGNVTAHPSCGCYESWCPYCPDESIVLAPCYCSDATCY